MSSFKRVVSRNFGTMCNSYEMHATAHKKAAKKLYKLISNSQNCNTVLEIGCGTGILTELLVQKFPNIQVIASDISTEMVFMQKNKKELSKNCQFLVCDGEFLPCARHLDLIISNLAFQWFENFEHTLKILKSASKTVMFSILMDGSFKNWAILHELCGIKNPMLALKTEQQLKHYIIDIEEIEINFESGLAFLKHIQGLGANGVSHYKIGDLRKLIKASQEKIAINYKVGYCVMQNAS